MNKLLTTICAAVIAILATPNQAEAGVKVRIGSSNTYLSGRTSYGTPIYTKRTVYRFDRYGRPVYNYYRLPIAKSKRNSYRGPVANNRSGASSQRSRNQGRNQRSR